MIVESNRSGQVQTARPVTKITNFQVEGTNSSPIPLQSAAPVGLSVADSSSGGGGVSGISDLFSGFGNFFSDLTHPGTGATTPSSAPSSAQPNSLLLIGAALGAFFWFRR